MPNTPLPDPVSSVLEKPLNGFTPLSTGGVANLVISVASAADTITAWGLNQRVRDLELRAFFPTEPMFLSALFTVISQYVTFRWSLKGPPRMAGISQRMLNTVQQGQGWEALVTPFLIDLSTQDNGAFMEIVRTDDDYRAPCVTLNHLDSYRCVRTGDYKQPVIYVDLKGNWHKLRWYQVIHMTDFPSPIEEAKGVGYCALTRILRAAQTIRDIGVVKQEKAGGRFTRQIHLVSGVARSVIEDVQKQKQFEADQAGLFRFIQPLIVTTLDPTARVTKETIDMASVPEDWDDEKSVQAYILAMSMAFGTDYQNLAPLPGGGLGSASISKVLNMKARGKGPGLFMNKMARVFNFMGILPDTVTFEFGEQDIAQQMEKTELRKARALEREIRIRSGEITTEVARQMATDDGDLDERYLIMMQEANATHEVVAVGTEPVQAFDEDDVKPGMAGPKEPPQGSVARPPNSNDKRPRAPSNNQKRNPGGTPEGGARA